MTTSKLERAVLAGGCFWGMQDLIRKLPARWTRDCRARDQTLERYVLSDAAREDYLASFEGNRFAESLRYVQSYPTELEALRDVLPSIQTTVQIISGRRDAVVPLVNAEYLHERLPHSELRVVDAGHFVWEDADDEYAALVTAWWAGGFKAWMTTSTAAAAVPGDASTQ